MKRKAGSEARLECALSHSPCGGLALLLFNDRRDLLQVVYVARTFPGKSKEMSEIEDRPLRQTALVSTGSLTPLLWQGALSPRRASSSSLPHELRLDDKTNGCVTPGVKVAAHQAEA